MTLFFIKRGRVARILERKKVKVQSEKSVEKKWTGLRDSLHCRFSHDVTKIETTKLLILLRFHDV